MFGKRLTRARKAMGLSMKALGELVGVSANAIKKYEHDDNLPSSGNLYKLAKALNVRSEYFFRSSEVNLDGVEYRKRTNTPKKILDQIDGDVLDQAERWHELIDLYPDSVKPVQEFKIPKSLPSKIKSHEEIEHFAQEVRKAWSLGENPIPDVIDTLESLGIMVIITDVEAGNKFDGLAGTVGGSPVIVISSNQTGDRQRFTLCHEIGHLLLGNRLSESIDEESACNHFAGAFLLPKPVLTKHIGCKRHAVEARELYLLKHEFGISMLGILVRLRQSEIISESLQKRYFMAFSKQGWRKTEPGEPYIKEKTFLFKQLVYRALAEDYISESKAAELMKMPLSTFHKERKLEMTIADTD